MGRRAAAWCLALGALLLASPSAAPWIAPARAANLDRAEIDRLTDEGTRWFREAGNTDHSRDKRNAALKKAYDLLKSAYRILDSWCDAHPGDVERLDGEMVQLNMKIFWIKKEAPLGVLHGNAPVLPDSPRAKPRPKPEPKADPGTAPGPGEQPAPAKPAPPPPPAKPRPAIEVAREHEKQKPHDISGGLDRWLDVLVEVGDARDSLYGEALGRVAELSERLKSAYRELRDDDPDSIKVAAEPGKERAVAEQLAMGLDAAGADDRLRAADQLAALGYTPAAQSVYQALRREKEADVRERLFLALVRLGGRRTCETLAKFAKERKPSLPEGAVTALTALAKRGPVQARYACESLGEFGALAKKPIVAAGAVTALQGLGPAAVNGLVRSADTKHRDVEEQVLRALGGLDDPRAAFPLSKRLLTKGDEDLRKLSITSLEQLGRKAVPALIGALRTKKTRQYAGSVLYGITGETFGEDARAWAQWWKAEQQKK